MMFEVAESGGFEPPEACTSTVFETVPFVRSGNSPGATLHNAPGWLRTGCCGWRARAGELGLAAGSKEGGEQLGTRCSFDPVTNVEGVAEARIHPEVVQRPE